MDYHVFRQCYVGSDRVLFGNSIVAHEIMGAACTVLGRAVHVHFRRTLP
jgi:hypothetical protein